MRTGMLDKRESQGLGRPWPGTKPASVLLGLDFSGPYSSWGSGLRGHQLISQPLLDGFYLNFVLYNHISRWRQNMQVKPATLYKHKWVIKSMIDDWLWLVKGVSQAVKGLMKLLLLIPANRKHMRPLPLQNSDSGFFQPFHHYLTSCLQEKHRQRNDTSEPRWLGRRRRKIEGGGIPLLPHCAGRLLHS